MLRKGKHCFQAVTLWRSIVFILSAYISSLLAHNADFSSAITEDNSVKHISVLQFNMRFFLHHWSITNGKAAMLASSQGEIFLVFIFLNLVLCPIKYHQSVTNEDRI